MKNQKNWGDERLPQVRQELKAEYLDEKADRFDGDLDDVLAIVKSPIEQLMATALFYAISSEYWHGDLGNENNFSCDDNIDPIEVLFENPPLTHGVNIWAQVPVGTYRADFIVRYAHWRGGIAFGAIECDGHDHHDLTKEQAIRDRERDRYFQARGLLILRYTGKEIWRAPLKCASGALVLMERRAENNPSSWWREQIEC